jgi:hypothetical protein
MPRRYEDLRALKLIALKEYLPEEAPEVGAQYSELNSAERVLKFRRPSRNTVGSMPHDIPKAHCSREVVDDIARRFRSHQK